MNLGHAALCKIVRSSCLPASAPRKRKSTYQICQRVQLLPHQTALAPPPSHLAIHEIKEQSEGHESQRSVHIAEGVWGPETVTQGGEDGHEAAEA